MGIASLNSAIYTCHLERSREIPCFYGQDVLSHERKMAKCIDKVPTFCEFAKANYNCNKTYIDEI